MENDLLTTREAAALAGTGTSSIKRWADDGTLACLRTVGGHRRFRRADVERLVAGAPGAGPRSPAPPAPPDPVDQWIDLMTGPDPGDVTARLLDERAARGSWFAVGDFLGVVLAELGRRWADGRLTVIAEHLASERLARALAHVAATLPSSRRAPVALLVAGDGDDHTLGLSLAELCLCEAGWRTRWAGRATPTDDVVAAIATGGVAMVALSASVAGDRRRLARQVATLARACAEHRVELAVGGGAPWPPRIPNGHRLRDLAGLHQLAARRGRGRR